MSKVQMMSDQVYRFWCPGCEDYHIVHVNGKKNGSGATWKFDMNLDRPTFSPSINLRTGIYADANWIPPNQQEHWSVICHSFVREGRIEYCGDSTHSMRGKTVELPDL